MPLTFFEASRCGDTRGSRTHNSDIKILRCHGKALQGEFELFVSWEPVEVGTTKGIDGHF